MVVSVLLIVMMWMFVGLGFLFGWDDWIGICWSGCLVWSNMVVVPVGLWWFVSKKWMKFFWWIEMDLFLKLIGLMFLWWFRE